MLRKENAIDRAAPQSVDQVRVDRMCLDALSNYAPLICYSNFGFSLLCVLAAWRSNRAELALAWVATMGLVCAIRVRGARRCKEERHLRSTREWMRWFTVMSAWSGLLWGAGAWVLLQAGDITTQAIFAFVASGLASGAATTHSVHRPALWSFVLPAAALIGARFLMFPGGVDLLLAFMAVLGVSLYLRVGGMNRRILHQSFALRAANRRLIEELEDARTAMHRANTSLERRIEERTNSLECEIQARYEAERQLRRSHRMEAVGRLTGGIAHDFNNVLTVILNCLELATPRAKEDAVMIDHAVSAATRGAALTQQLLSFSRKSPLVPEVLEINRVVKELVECMVRPVLRESIALEFLPSDGPAQVQVHRAELDTALLNLLLNARDAMPSGGVVRVAVKLHEREVTVEVQDQGIGIDPRDLERVFDASYSTKGEEGTGLGLSMVRGFALRSSGDIRAESSSAGTTFYLTLPTCTSASIKVPAVRTRMMRAPCAATVLVVEDNAALLSSTIKVVQELGYHSESAEDAQQALLKMASGTIDILLSDIRMPGTMSGIDLARAVAKSWPLVQTVLVTGHAPELSQGAEFRVLRKPYAVRELAKALHDAASKPGVYASLTPTIADSGAIEQGSFK